MIDAAEFLSDFPGTGVGIEEAEWSDAAEHGPRPIEPDSRFLFCAEDTNRVVENTIDTHQTIRFVLMEDTFIAAAGGGALGDTDEIE